MNTIFNEPVKLPTVDVKSKAESHKNLDYLKIASSILNNLH